MQPRVLASNLFPVHHCEPSHPPHLSSSADLEGYLAQERRRAPCGDPQHIYNKLLFDAAAEALAAHHAQVRPCYRLLALRLFDAF